MAPRRRTCRPVTGAGGRSDRGACPADTIRIELAGSPSTLSEARSIIGRWVAEQGGDDDLCRRAALIVSELASNAVQVSSLPYSLIARRVDGARVELVVSNRSELPLPARSAWGPTDRLAVCGRGLTIVAALSDALDIEHCEGSVLVRAQLCLVDLNRP